MDHLDETSVQLSYAPQKMYNFKNPEKRVQPIVQHSKACFTAICIVGADGRKYDPIIMVPGKTENSGKVLNDLEYEGYKFKKLFTEEGWVNSNSMLEALAIISEIRDNISPDHEIALVLDSFRAHLDPAVLNEAKDRNITIIPVPANGTAIYQTLDIGVFGVLKQKLRQHYREWMESLNPTKSNTDVMFSDGVRRFLTAWNEISELTIISAWNKIPGFIQTIEEDIKPKAKDNADLKLFDDILDKKEYEQKLTEISQLLRLDEDHANIKHINEALILRTKDDTKEVCIGKVNQNDKYCDITNHFSEIVDPEIILIDENINIKQRDQTESLSKRQNNIKRKIICPNYSKQDEEEENSDVYVPTKHTKRCLNDTSKLKKKSKENESDVYVPTKHTKRCLNDTSQLKKNVSDLNSNSTNKNLNDNSKKMKESEENEARTDYHPLSTRTKLVTSRSTFIFKPSKNKKYYGFFNMGNTCYINSTLISLYHSSIFTHFLEKITKEFKFADNTIVKNLHLLFQGLTQNEEILKSQENVFLQLLDKNRTFISLFNADRNNNQEDTPLSNIQHDAQTFLSFIIDEIAKEISKFPIASDFTKIMFIQYSHVTYNKEAPNKLSTNNTVDTPIFYFAFDHSEKGTSDAQLLNVFMKEKLFINNCPSVIRLQFLPAIICMSYNLSEYVSTINPQTGLPKGNIQKIHSQIALSYQLNFNKDCFYPNNAKCLKQYQIYAIIIHIGNTTTNGHFISYIRPNPNSEWYEFNDNKVTSMNDEDILLKEDIQRNCYISFYKIK